MDGEKAHLLDGEPPVRIEAIRQACEASHLYFSRLMFKARDGVPMLVGPHHRVMSETIDRVINGEIKRLLITVPPGYSKTQMAVIMLAARGYAVNPRARFIHASYADKLVNQNSSSIRDVLALPEYQTMWPRTLRADQASKGLWSTPEGGIFVASPAGGSVTGFRAGTMEKGFTGALIIDDPLKPDDAGYDTKREHINARFMNTFRSRLAHEDVPIIVIMQRIHPRDFANHLLTGGGGEKFHHLLLPVVVDNSKSYPSEYTHGVEIEHGLEDGPLWPEKHDRAQIDVLRRDGRVFSAQYMQDPRISEHAAFPPHTFAGYEVRPRTLNVAILVDPSSGASKNSDRTAIAVVGVDAHGNRYLLDGYCHRMPLSERWDLLVRLWRKWSAAPGVKYVAVGYEKVGLQTDTSYFKERQEMDGVHFPIEELNWPRSGGHSKEDRIQRLEPEFKAGRFFMPAVVYRQEEGGNCLWVGEERGVVFRPLKGVTSSQRRVSDAGEPWRIAEAVKRTDETGQIYDLTYTLMRELEDFPAATHDDLSDAVSRIFDMDMRSANPKEMRMVEQLNEELVA